MSWAQPTSHASPRSTRSTCWPIPLAVDAAIYPNAVAVSAVTGQGLEALLAKIGEVLTEDMLYLRALVPYSRGDLLEQWRRRGRVLRQNETEEGTRVEGLAPRA